MNLRRLAASPIASSALMMLLGCVATGNGESRNAADELAIVELCNRSAHSMDHGDPETWIATWAPEGSGETPWDGQMTLAEMEESARTKWAEPRPHRHILANHMISIQGETATHRCYAYLVRIESGAAEPLFVVEYDDRLRKIDGEWKFVHRKITLQK